MKQGCIDAFVLGFSEGIVDVGDVRKFKCVPYCL